MPILDSGSPLIDRAFRAKLHISLTCFVVLKYACTNLIQLGCAPCESARRLMLARFYWRHIMCMSLQKSLSTGNFKLVHGVEEHDTQSPLPPCCDVSTCCEGRCASRRPDSIVSAGDARKHVRDAVQYSNPSSRSARPMILG